MPDSTLASVFEVLEKQSTFPYIPAVREDNAVAVAVGAYLGGKKAMVFMQNSGLGHCINALTSLVSLYRIPLLLVIGWRGHDPGADAPEHRLMGIALPSLLRAIQIPFWSPEPREVHTCLGTASSWSVAEQMPGALLIRDGVLK